MLDHNVHECATLLIAEQHCLCDAGTLGSSRCPVTPFPRLCGLNRSIHDLILRDRPVVSRGCSLTFRRWRENVITKVKVLAESSLSDRITITIGLGYRSQFMYLLAASEYLT
jgi:hypothetical protein